MTGRPPHAQTYANFDGYRRADGALRHGRGANAKCRQDRKHQYGHRVVPRAGKGSHTTGQPPRYSDPAVKPLLDTVLDTKQIESGKPVPWSDVQKLTDWSKAATRIGLVYYLAGTGTKDLNVVANDPKLTQKANQNTVTFAPEFGRYLRCPNQSAIRNDRRSVGADPAATPEQRKDPEFRKTLNNISDDAAKSVIGLLGTFVLEGLPDEWQFRPRRLLLEMTPKAAKFMAPDDRQLLRNAAAEAAAQIKIPT